MANNSVSFNTDLKPTVLSGLSGADMTIDATVQDAHEASVTITKHPVEWQANISDHIIAEPRVYTLTGRITPAPLHESSSSKTPAMAWKTLQKTMFNRKFVTISTNLRTYENMVIQSLSAKQDWKTALVLDFEAVFREVFVANAPSTTTTDTSQGGGASGQEPATNPEPQLKDWAGFGQQQPGQISTSNMNKILAATGNL